MDITKSAYILKYGNDWEDKWIELCPNLDWLDEKTLRMPAPKVVYVTEHQFRIIMKTLNPMERMLDKYMRLTYNGIPLEIIRK